MKPRRRTPEQNQYMQDKHFCAYCHEFGRYFKADPHYHFRCGGELVLEHIWDGQMFRVDIESNWLPACKFVNGWKSVWTNQGRVLGTFVKMKWKEWDQEAMRAAIGRDPLERVEFWRDEGKMPGWVNDIATLVLEMV